MKPTIIVLASVAALLGSPACAEATYLDRVESEVYQTTGDHQAITKRAITCITQVVKPGFTTAPTITSSDPEAGIVVANNAFTYSYGFLLQYRARSTLTFQAKDGRFRIVHTNIEKFNDTKGLSIGWQRIGTWSMSGGEEAKLAIDAISMAVAECVKSPAPANDNW